MNNPNTEDDYISLNIIEAPESDYLYTETSQIKNAGTGLFTAIDIFEEEIVALFKGEIINNQEAEKRALLNEDRYFVNLLDGSIMDSMHTDCFAKYANDAEGLMESSFKNNAIITLDDDNNVCIKAIRNIDAGEEIFCSYGKPYWKKHAN
ncbi:SET domain-containing protein-lysine N-methyltransferase [Winogradskyella litoriviva]|uniref:SET domain-containing protein-lysine N-methyltransferase n=1 Tax=Winogradskyella litoriviva TaxID=1220182 RepID=UPI0018850DE8|nr:SET domain-containing protein-lysine N-methyltransferase [Winogradskyella litoriviva]